MSGSMQKDSYASRFAGINTSAIPNPPVAPVSLAATPNTIKPLTRQENQFQNISKKIQVPELVSTSAIMEQSKMPLKRSSSATDNQHLYKFASQNKSKKS
jgi:hypothetical protein